MISYIKVSNSYQLVEDYSVQTEFLGFGDKSSQHGRVKIANDGMLTISNGYCWDGASGPVIDRDSNMRAGLVHDALYQLMREDVLNHHHWKRADKEYGKILKEDGAYGFVIAIDLAGLKLVGGRYANPKMRKKVFHAPKN